VVRYWPAGTIKPHTQFEAEVYVLGRMKGVVTLRSSKGYRPQFYSYSDVLVRAKLTEGIEMLSLAITSSGVTLIAPIAMGRWSALRDSRQAAVPLVPASVAKIIRLIIEPISPLFKGFCYF